MATLNPLLDPAPANTPPAASQFAPGQFTAAPFAPAQAVAPPPNLLLGVLRRWPWLLLGLAAGLVLGLLYHMQRAPVYQSNAQLLVIKNRPEAGLDARVAFVEDYVATQVVLLRSELVLELAAKEIDKHQPFQIPPPASQGERVAFLNTRFAVTREKEPGSNTLSNILQLTFKALHPADAPKYMQAIIDAYKGQLATVYSAVSEDQLKHLGKEIDALKANQKNLDTTRRAKERELRGEIDNTGTAVGGISQEELTSVRARISANRDAKGRLELNEIRINGDLHDINQVAFGTRATRMAVMTRLGIPIDRPNIFGDARDLDSMYALLKYQQAELATRLGPGHPDMLSLRKRIEHLEKELKERGGPLEDELDRHKRKLENELGAIKKQLDSLNNSIAADERNATRMSGLQEEINGLKEAMNKEQELQRDRERERLRVESTKDVGGYKVEAITRPGDGVQVAPVLAQSLLLGAVVGLLLGSGLGLWAELADRGFRSPIDIRRHLGVPVLGHVPPIRVADPPEFKPVAALDPILAVMLRPHSAEAEAVRGIRTQLLFTTSGAAHQVIQITSPNPGDGKSTLAANLAVSLATSGKRVVLVDCDFRKPRVHRIFALAKAELGLASVVADQADLGAVVQGCEIENLSLLPCGPRPANPAELLTTPKFQEVLDDLRANYDFVVLDTPPVLAVSDPAAVAPRADGVILVFRMTKDARPAAERAKEDLTAVGGKLLGVVVNASTEREMGYGYGHGYRYDYQYTDSYADPKA